MSGIKNTKSSVPWAVVRRRIAKRGRSEGFMPVLNSAARVIERVSARLPGIYKFAPTRNDFPRYALTLPTNEGPTPRFTSLLITTDERGPDPTGLKLHGLTVPPPLRRCTCS
jgi:hypothetical protein